MIGRNIAKRTITNIVNRHTLVITKLDIISTTVISFLRENNKIVCYMMSNASIRVPKRIANSGRNAQNGWFRVIKSGMKKWSVSWNRRRKSKIRPCQKLTQYVQTWSTIDTEHVVVEMKKRKKHSKNCYWKSERNCLLLL